MSLLSKYTLNIKDILIEYLLDVIADIILQYTGSFVQVSKHCLTQPFIEEYYFLTANVLSVCIFNYKQDYVLYFAIKNNIGRDEEKVSMIPHMLINKMSPTKNYIFYNNARSDYDSLRIYNDNIISVEKCLCAVDIFIEEENDYIEYTKYGCFFNTSQCYRKKLNKKEYDQFVGDFQSICEVIFDITEKIDL
jgi:hypothetical protein